MQRWISSLLYEVIAQHYDDEKGVRSLLAHLARSEYLLTGILAVEEAVLIFALGVDLLHWLAVLLNFVVLEEDEEGSLLVQLQPLPDYVKELLKWEFSRDQISN